MKKLFAAALFCLCFTACGSAQYYEGLDYSIMDNTSETARSAEIDKVISDFNMTGGRRVVNGDDTFVIDEKKAPDDVIEPPDMENFLSEMDDITDEVFAEKSDDIGVYRDKKYKNFIIVQESDSLSEYYNNINDVYLKTEEYNTFARNIEKRTGLIYCGTRLGKDYTKPMVYEKDAQNFVYTGKNTLTFSNSEHMLNSLVHRPSEDCVYKNAPLQTVLFMDKDDIDCVYIYWQNGDFVSGLTKTNLEQLDINDTYGSAAQELVSRFFDADNETSGTHNGIKYKLRLIKSVWVNSPDGKLLVLEK